MANFHGVNKKHSFFEGWYLKHVKDDTSIAVIPAFHVNENGEKSVSIQVITGEKSYHIPFDAEEFRASRRQFQVRIGKNLFSDKGMKLDIQTDGVEIKGRIRYHNFTPIQYDIMGPFTVIPFMQCNHGVVSMFHTLEGKISINGQIYHFQDGHGYIEKDWGSSFPDTYFWSQCTFIQYKPISIMISIADIPMVGSGFTGCIAIVYYKGKEYRFATYLGTKVLQYTDKEVILKQGNMILRADIVSQPDKKSYSLKAPVKGDMSRFIKETITCSVRYRFYTEEELIFDQTSDKASIEVVK